MSDDIPPLPKGAILDSPTNLPPLPKGATLEGSAVASPEVPKENGLVSALKKVANWAEQPRPGIVPLRNVPGKTDDIETVTPEIIAGPIGALARGMVDVGTLMSGGSVPAEDLQKNAASVAGVMTGDRVTPVAAAAGAAGKIAKPIVSGLGELAQSELQDAAKVSAETAARGPGLLSGITGKTASMLGRASSMTPKPAAQAAHELGYVIPPTMAAKEKPNAVGALMSGEGGKHKLWQAASYYNQPVTTNIAKKELGLPENTNMTPETFDAIRKEVGKTRDAIRDILPPMEIKGTDFEKAVKGISQADAELQKAFPKLTATNPKIVDLQEDLLRNPSMTSSQAIELTRRLRHDATINFKNSKDPDAQALAVAQIRASDALEDMVQSRVETAPADITKTMRRINKERTETLENIIKAREEAFKAYDEPTRLTYTRQEGEKIADDHQNRAAEAVERTEQYERKLADLQKEDEDIRKRAQRLDALKSRGNLVKSYEDARQLAAKSYDVEMALNPATQEVSAKQLWALQKMGRPLSGGLKDIADSYGSFPQAMQTPTSFGGVEDFSVLDLALSGQNLAHGNVGGSLAALARPLARATVLSKPFQKSMMKGRTQAENIAQSIKGPGTP